MLVSTWRRVWPKGHKTKKLAISQKRDTSLSHSDNFRCPLVNLVRNSLHPVSSFNPRVFLVSRVADKIARINIHPLRDKASARKKQQILKVPHAP